MNRQPSIVTAVVLVIVLSVILAFLGAAFIKRESPQEAYERGYEQGCVDIIKAYYRNQPYYKAILDSRMYEDTILMGWIVRQFKDPYLPDPELSIEDDTIAVHAWDSLGYCVLTGAHRDTAIWTISLKALKDLYRASPMFLPCIIRKVNHPTDTMPATQIHPDAQRGQVADSMFDLYFSEPRAFVSRYDPTDTMPAEDWSEYLKRRDSLAAIVDTMPSKPLYEKVIYNEYGSFSVYPPDTTFGDYLVNSHNIDRIDTVWPSGFVDFPAGVCNFYWDVWDDSTLYRYLTVGDDTAKFYREQVHLKQGRSE